MVAFSSPAKADGGEKVSSLDASDGGKRKVAGTSKKRAGAVEPPPHNHWLMKSEPESRFENGVDVKVCWNVPGSASAWLRAHGSGSPYSLGSRI